MDLYSIRNQRISPNSPCFALFSLRSCVALLARGAAYRKKKGFGRKKSRFPFVTKSPSRIRCGRVLVTLLVAATASHLNAASSVFLLKPGWSVQAYTYTLAPYQSNSASLSYLPSSLFWRGFLLGQEVTRRHIIRLDHES